MSDYEKGVSQTAVKALSWTLSILGIAILSFASFKYLGVYEKKQDWTRTEGKVAHLIFDAAEGGAAPVVLYAWHEDSLAYTSSTYASPPAHEVGDLVELYVDPANPHDAIINSFTEIYFLPVILGAIGIVLALIGFVILYNAKRI